MAEVAEVVDLHRQYPACAIERVGGVADFGQRDVDMAFDAELREFIVLRDLLGLVDPGGFGFGLLQLVVLSPNKKEIGCFGYQIPT
jgi:hypothetical protein